MDYMLGRIGYEAGRADAGDNLSWPSWDDLVEFPRGYRTRRAWAAAAAAVATDVRANLVAAMTLGGLLDASAYETAADVVQLAAEISTMTEGKPFLQERARDIVKKLKALPGVEVVLQRRYEEREARAQEVEKKIGHCGCTACDGINDQQTPREGSERPFCVCPCAGCVQARAGEDGPS